MFLLQNLSYPFLSPPYFFCFTAFTLSLSLSFSLLTLHQFPRGHFFLHNLSPLTSSPLALPACHYAHITPSSSGTWRSSCPWHCFAASFYSLSSLFLLSDSSIFFPKCLVFQRCVLPATPDPVSFPFLFLFLSFLPFGLFCVALRLFLCWLFGFVFRFSGPFCVFLSSKFPVLFYFCFVIFEFPSFWFSLVLLYACSSDGF